MSIIMHSSNLQLTMTLSVSAMKHLYLIMMSSERVVFLVSVSSVCQLPLGQCRDSLWSSGSS